MLCSDNPDLQNEKSEALLLFIHLFFGFETQFAIPLPYFLLPLHD